MKWLFILSVIILVGAGCQTKGNEGFLRSRESKFPDDVSREAYESSKLSLPPHFAACFSTKKLTCTEGVCEELTPITFWLLAGDRSNGTLSRCDAKGCDAYDALAVQSGIFEVIQPKGAGQFLFKRQLLDVTGNPADPSSFIDIAPIGLTVVLSTGYCID